MAYGSVALRINTDCPSCRQPLPLNGIADSVLCSHCNQPLKTPPDFWRKILEDEVPHGVGLAEGEEYHLNLHLSSYSPSMC